MTCPHKMVKVAIQMHNNSWDGFQCGTNMKPISRRMNKEVAFWYLKGEVKLHGLCHIHAFKSTGKLSN